MKYDELSDCYDLPLLALLLMFFLHGPLPEAAALGAGVKGKPVSLVHCFKGGGVGNILFLHGIIRRSDPFNRIASLRVVRKIASELGVRLAAPKSGLPCRGGAKMCWNMFSSRSALISIVRKLSKASGHCFVPGKPVIWIGFSNGGYLVNKWATRCLLKRPDTLVAIGSAGRVSKNTAGMQGCSPLYVMASKDEAVYESAKSFFRQYSDKRGNASFSSFAGGHRVPYPELKELVRQLLAGSH